jgi:hypothetical protein
MVGRASHFRLYLFDGKRGRGERLTRLLPISATEEADAIREADQLRGGQYAELWHRENVVKVFELD